MQTKKCSKCGEEKSVDEFYKGRKKCKKCKREEQKKYRKTLEIYKKYEKTEIRKKQIKEYHKEYQKKNYEKRILYIEKYKCTKNFLEKKDKRKEYQYNYHKKYKIQNKKRSKESVENIDIPYAKKLLKHEGFLPESITPELIEVKQIILKTKRLCKTSKI